MYHKAQRYTQEQSLLQELRPASGMAEYQGSGSKTATESLAPYLMASVP
jgi:hypothetical protein